MKKEKLIELLKNWLNELYENDSSIITDGISERNVLANFKCYLQKYSDFSDYNIDVEYNREWEWNNPKRNCENNPTTADLLIHTRHNENEWNLLYCEAKMWFNESCSNTEQDISTIKCFVNKFNYEYWIFIIFHKNKVLYKILINWEDVFLGWEFNFN